MAFVFFSSHSFFFTSWRKIDFLILNHCLFSFHFVCFPSILFVFHPFVCYPSILFVFHPFCLFSIHFVCFPSFLFVFHLFCLFSIHFVCFPSILFIFHPFCLFSIHFVCFPSILFVFSQTNLLFNNIFCSVKNLMKNFAMNNPSFFCSFLKNYCFFISLNDPSCSSDVFVSFLNNNIVHKKLCLSSKI